MKNHVILMLFVVGSLGCDRLKLDEQTKIQIQLPQAQSVMSHKGMVTTFGGRPVPSGVTGSTPINCYLIAAGGPEEALQRNICKRDDTASVSTFAPRKVGLWTGAAPAGSSLSFDVPSGKDRVIYVVGFHAVSAAACRDFKAHGFPNDSELSHPYLMGEKGGLELKPGETKDLPLEVTFNENNRFDNCKGPDFPEDGGGEGINSPSTPTTLTVTKNFFPFQKFANSSCQSFDLILEDSQGRQSSFGSPFTVGLNVEMEGTSHSMYTNYEDCNADVNVQTTFTFPANTNRMQVVFRTVYNYPTPVTVTATSIASPSALAFSAPIMSVEDGAGIAPDLFGPDRLLPGVCYPMTAKLKQISNGPVYNYSATSSNILYDAATLGVYSTAADCTADANPLSMVNFPSYQIEAPLYVKMKSSTVMISPIIFQAGTFLQNTKGLYRGDGTATASRLDIRGINQFGGISYCHNEPHEVFFTNEMGVPLINTTATTVNLSGSGLSFYGNTSDCVGASNPIYAVNIAAGEVSGKYFVRPNAAGPTAITASLSGFISAFYGINVNGPTSLLLAPMGPTVLGNLACMQISATLLNHNGSILQNQSATMTVSVLGAESPSSFTIYEDNTCTYPSGGSLIISGSGPAVKNFSVKVDNQSGSLKNVDVTATALSLPVSNMLTFQISP
ncbi:MAG: hypothetical protein HUU57_05040 [Bdellovibrio sp.]|nr:hypothetical protein [Bdellovibrio sp.]